ncbi:phosphoinositide 3-kinase adapter protein 1-like [Labeo rohita]|uniref:phosphoinositide 3-kinase adapter protein 1-like n=1 Tax=Labeo rohita TaxID=84645 RepID=UPI0021E20283|nr:phosphoinositide 3-kinase adapter protein 1-like [Labeo rohita]
MASTDAEVEFSGNKQRVRVKPVNWNECTLSVTAPDFTAGDVIVTLYNKGLVKGNAYLQYYTIMEDIAHFIQQAADPVKFMCQAFQVSSLEKLDQTLASCLMRKMPTGGFQGLQCDQSLAGESLRLMYSTGQDRSKPSVLCVRLQQEREREKSGECNSARHTEQPLPG